MIRCDCCGKPHRLETLIPTRPDIRLGDPPPRQGGHVAFYCQAYLRRRARFARELEKAYHQAGRRRPA